jgi:hypothetical protein
MHVLAAKKFLCENFYLFKRLTAVSEGVDNNQNFCSCGHVAFFDEYHSKLFKKFKDYRGSSIHICATKNL